MAMINAKFVANNSSPKEDEIDYIGIKGTAVYVMIKKEIIS
jgi:hypothetical protein